MRNKPIETGSRYGLLTVMGEHDKRDRQGSILWECSCECGGVALRRRGELVGAKSATPCCGRHCKMHPRLKHGMRFHKAYYVWQQMLLRCNNPNNKAFKNYGARGIEVCPEWEDFSTFWGDMGNDYREGLSLERIDNDGGYNKENCRWATRSEQARNTRDQRFIQTASGYERIADVAEQMQIPYWKLLGSSISLDELRVIQQSSVSTK